MSNEPNPLALPWKLWPTHWAGGSSSRQLDGHNVPWIEDANGREVCRLTPGRWGGITAETYARAELIVAAVNAYRQPPESPPTRSETIEIARSMASHEAREHRANNPQ